MGIVKIKSGRGAPMVHGSSLAYSGGHELLAFFSGREEGAATVIEVFRDGKAFATAGISGLPSWNPVWGDVCGGSIRLFWKSGYTCGSWNGMYSLMDVETGIMGHYVLPAGWVGPARTRPLEHEKGLLCGSSQETSIRWRPHLELYAIGEKLVPTDKWHLTRPVVEELAMPNLSRSGMIQPALLKWKDRVLAFLRSTPDIGCVGCCDASEAMKGQTRGVRFMNDLLICNSGIDVAEVGGRAFIAYNPSMGRGELRMAELSISDDPSKVPKVQRSWTVVKGLTEVSYPCLVVKDGKLMMSYTDERKHISITEVVI